MKIQIKIEQEEYKALLDNEYGNEKYFIESIAKKLGINQNRISIGD